MISKDTAINFSGITHDHSILELNSASSSNNLNADDCTEKNDHNCAQACSKIAIMKRLTMYDSLILVKKYRSCLGGYSLEFPVDIANEDFEQTKSTNETTTPASIDQIEPNSMGDDTLHESSREPFKKCAQRRLTTLFFDGDDPIYPPPGCVVSGPSVESGDSTNPNRSLFASQIDDKGDPCTIVHVPINGLLDRLRTYTKNGIAVDSRVYAFAMGLKTAERILTTNSMKELEETPV